MNEWLGAALESSGRKLTGPVIECHRRPWSMVLEVPTDQGRVFLKTTTPATAHEPALVAALAGWGVPGVMTPIAVDLERGWLLLPDGGGTVGDTADRGEALARWESSLRTYAELQVAAAPHADELVAAGVPDLRLERTQPLLDALAPKRRPEIERRVHALRARLGERPVPASVQHDDLHGWNIFWSDSGAAISDWGDAGVSHPFMTMTVALRVVDHSLHPDAAELARLRAAYLEPWGELGDEATLDAAIDLGRLWRAIGWHRIVTALPDPVDADYTSAPAAWVEMFLEGG